MINVGAMIINENAINVLYTVPASVEKYASPTGSVLILLYLLQSMATNMNPAIDNFQ